MNLIINDYILITLLALSIYFDLTKKKIPNFLTFPVMLWGLCFYTFTGKFEGFLFSLFGLLLGIGLFLIPFMMGGMGGGDVKLLGAIGALKGVEFIFTATLYTALCGGVIAVIYLIFKGQFLVTLKKVIGIAVKPFLFLLSIKFKNPFLNNLSLLLSSPQQDKNAPLSFPYGVAIGLGTVITLSRLGSSFLPL